MINSKSDTNWGPNCVSKERFAPGEAASKPAGRSAHLWRGLVKARGGNGEDRASISWRSERWCVSWCVLWANKSASFSYWALTSKTEHDHSREFLGFMAPHRFTKCAHWPLSQLTTHFWIDFAASLSNSRN